MARPASTAVAEMGDHADRPASGGSLAAEISSAMVRLLSEYTGRGPTKARTYLNDDLITVVLRDTLTKADRSLVASGADEHVLHTRRLVQEAMREDMIAMVQRLTGHQVVALLSANHVEPDVAIESLLLDGPAWEPAP